MKAQRTPETVDTMLMALRGQGFSVSLLTTKGGWLAALSERELHEREAEVWSAVADTPFEALHRAVEAVP